MIKEDLEILRAAKVTIDGILLSECDPDDFCDIMQCRYGDIMVAIIEDININHR